MFHFLTRLFHRSSSEPDFPPELLQRRLPLGPSCERIACWYLETKYGMTCFNHNIRTHMTELRGGITGELDLVMQETNGSQNTIVFVEVRSRTQYWFQFGTPLHSINYSKKNHVCHAAKAWLREHNIPLTYSVRFDAVGVVWPEGQKPEVFYMRNVFPWSL